MLIHKCPNKYECTSVFMRELFYFFLKKKEYVLSSLTAFRYSEKQEDLNLSNKIIQSHGPQLPKMFETSPFCYNFLLLDCDKI